MCYGFEAAIVWDVVTLCRDHYCKSFHIKYTILMYNVLSHVCVYMYFVCICDYEGQLFLSVCSFNHLLCFGYKIVSLSLPLSLCVHTHVALAVYICL